MNVLMKMEIKDGRVQQNACYTALSVYDAKVEGLSVTCVTDKENRSVDTTCMGIELYNTLKKQRDELSDKLRECNENIRILHDAMLKGWG